MPMIILFYCLIFVYRSYASTGNTYLKLIVNNRAVQGFTGDGSPALTASINSNEAYPWVDTNGNIFIPDQQNRRIRKVSAGSEIISTIGGNGMTGTTGVGGPILSTSFKFPTSIFQDTAGRFMYLSDQLFIWRFNISSGIISTIAGTVNIGFNADSIPASDAQINFPRGLWLTTDNDLYFADSLNYRIRKISSSGIITTIAGTGVQDSSGDGGPANVATLNQPYTVYVDTAGIMFIADFGAKNVRKIDSNNIITKLAGTGGAAITYNGDGFPAIYANMGPKDVKGDTLGNIYIVDNSNCRIRKVDLNGIITTFLGTGVCATSLQLTPFTTTTTTAGVDIATPRGMWIDSQANFYFLEAGVIVRRTIVADSAAPTISPTSAVASSNTYLQTLVGVGTSGYTGDNGPPLLAQINAVWFWVTPTNGNIYVLTNNRIRFVNVYNNIISSFGGTGTTSSAGVSAPIGSAEFFSLYSVVGDNEEDYLFFSDQRLIWQYSYSSGLVFVIAGMPSSAGINGDNGPASAAELNNPMGIWLSTSNDLFIADSANHRIRKISSGIITTVVGTVEGNSGDGGPALSAQLKFPFAGCLDSVGKMYIVDSGNARIRMVDTNSIITTFAGSGISSTIYFGDNIPATMATLAGPKAVIADRFGNVYITGSNYRRIVVVNPAGILTTYIGNGLGGSSLQLSPLRSNINTPNSLWIDSQDNLYFADSSSIRKTVRSITSSPTPLPVIPPANLFQKTIGGSFKKGYSGDGGPATSALMNPGSFWVSQGGVIVVPDSANYLIRRISPNGIIIYFGGSGSTSTAGASAPLASVSFFLPVAVVSNAAASRIYISDARYVWQYQSGTGIVSVFAGTASPGFSGDNDLATLAQINSPNGLWLTTGNDLYIADSSNHRIRKVSASSIITTVAGSSVGSTYSGDSGQATSASLSNPTAVYVDTEGSIYIADFGNHRIRLVDVFGIISTYCGTGTSGYNGNNIPATLASLNNPNDIKGDSLGNIYLADMKNCLIRVINTAGIISTVVGNEGICWTTRDISLASTSIDMPVAIWVDTLGTIYFNSNYNSIHRTVEITPTSMPSSQPSGQPSCRPSSQPSRRPSSQPISIPSSQPSRHPSSQPSRRPSSQPSGHPSSQPTRRPTAQPSAQPSRSPTRQPVSSPTSSPSSQPTRYPSARPSCHPSRQPTARPSEQPTSHPSCQPSFRPSSQPTGQPTSQPSCHPSRQPTIRPSLQPTSVPSCQPSSCPSSVPTTQPSLLPTGQPISRPSCSPTRAPSAQPSSLPSCVPVSRPSSQPTSQPAGSPTMQPSSRPTRQPISQPSSHPTEIPSTLPSSPPSNQPSSLPTGQPNSPPSIQPTAQPSCQPTRIPTSRPNPYPSSRPSCQPSSWPSGIPTCQPQGFPSTQPSTEPSSQPSSAPSSRPSARPTTSPSCSPSAEPTGQPTLIPTLFPSSRPSNNPSIGPSVDPTNQPSGSPTGKPCVLPTTEPSKFSEPTGTPSSPPSSVPTLLPTSQVAPACSLTTAPSGIPTTFSTSVSSSPQSELSTCQPTVVATRQPTWNPSVPVMMSSGPSLLPSSQHIADDSPNPSVPTPSPTAMPSFTSKPSPNPSCKPTVVPTTFNGNLSRFSVIGKSFTSFLFLFGSIQVPVNPASQNIDLMTNYLTDQETFVIFGQRTGFQKNFALGSHESISMSRRIAPSLIRDTKFRASSTVGDVNGDGFDDLVIGYPSSALCDVYLGTTNGFMNLPVSVTIHGETHTDFGWAVAPGTNDFNRDDYSDMVISSKVSGVVYVIFGKPLLPRDIYIATLTNSDGFKIIGNSFLFNFGLSIANGGDFNHDGYHDIIISASTASGEDVISVILGSAVLSDIHLDNPTSNKIYTIYASQFTFAGLSLAGLGDINQDGFDDIAIGSIPYQGKYVTQRTYIIYGREVKRQNESLSLSTLREGVDGIMITGGGFMVAGPGDVNGDDINDIMIVNYPNWQGQSNSYLLSFPEELISVPPTVLPSSFPSSQPSSFPSAVPTIAFTTNSPTNHLHTLSPLSSSTTHPPITLIPTAAPKSFRPSRQPTTSVPSKIPTFVPTRSPSVSPTLRTIESTKPTTAQPSSTVLPTRTPSTPPTRLPTNQSVRDSHLVLNGSFAVVVCLEGGDYYGTDANEVFQLIGGAPYYHITCRPSNSTRVNRKIFMLKPAKNRILIDGFDTQNDIIDLTSYSDILSINDLSFQENPLQFLPFTGQIVQFSGSSSFMFTESNFYFHVPTRPSARQTPTSVLLTMIPLIIVFLGMACFCFPVVIGNTVDDEKEKIINNDKEDVEASIRPVDADLEAPPSSDRNPQNSSNVVVVNYLLEQDLESGIRSESSSVSCDSGILGVDEEVSDNDEEDREDSFSNGSFGAHIAEFFTSSSSSSVKSDILVEKDEEEKEFDDEDDGKSLSSESFDMSYDSSSDWENNSDDEEDDSFSELQFV
jgi:sugar lactone lactonase YvrE